MAIGDPGNVQNRLRALLPATWFPKGASPVLDAVLAGAAAALSGIYGFAAYARLQTRIATAIAGMLDLIAYDFFGYSLVRQPNEADAAYRTRIRQNLFLPRGTRPAVAFVLKQLTGRAPVIFEPQRQADVLAGWGQGGMGWTTGPGLLGSPSYPYQMFVTAYRPIGQGVANVQGWGTPGRNPIGIGGWGARLLMYAPNNAASQIVSDADIYAAIAAVMPAGTVAWVQIKS